MNRIDKTLIDLKTKRKKMLSPYITAGDPTPDHTVGLMHSLANSGADIIEIGVPFSDPMAEGIVIQAAMERALHFDIDCDAIFDIVKTFRIDNQHTPIILMSYLNPIETYGYTNFAKNAVEAGVDGTIIVDLPPEEGAPILSIWNDFSLYPIFLCSPTTSLARMEKINQSAKGYLYYVSLKGVTGSQTLQIENLQSDYKQRKLQTNLPLMVGFGIQDAEMANKIAQFADGIIVGASLIKLVHTAFQNNENIEVVASSFIKDLRYAIDKLPGLNK